MILASATDFILNPIVEVATEFIGSAGVGGNWEQWRHNLGYVDYLVVVAIIVGVAYLILRRRRGTAAGSEALEAD